MDTENMPHPNHDQHLCWLTNVGFHRQDPEQYNKLVKDGKYVCGGCGRVAVDKGNLCDPVEL